MSNRLCSRRCLPYLAALAMLLHGATARGDSAPRLDAMRAAKIATDYLATLGPGAPYIVSVTLERASLVQRKQSWVIRWSVPFVADGERELGLRVNFDGTTARLVAEKPSGAGNPRVSGGRN